MKIYSIEDNYVKYLHDFDTHVFLNTGTGYKHTRKYVGYVIEMNFCQYYIPMSSGKNSDYVFDVTGIKTIRPNSVPLIRMVDLAKNKLYGTLDIGNMIPVPRLSLIEYDVNAETDYDYKNLLLAEIEFVKSNQDLILRNAKIMYNLKTQNRIDIKFVNFAPDFCLLEEKCKEWEKMNTR